MISAACRPCSLRHCKCDRLSGLVSANCLPVRQAVRRCAICTAITCLFRPEERALLGDVLLLYNSTLEQHKEVGCRHRAERPAHVYMCHVSCGCAEPALRACELDIHACYDNAAGERQAAGSLQSWARWQAFPRHAGAWSDTVCKHGATQLRCSSPYDFLRLLTLQVCKIVESRFDEAMVWDTVTVATKGPKRMLVSASWHACLYSRVYKNAMCMLTSMVWLTPQVHGLHYCHHHMQC